MGDVVISASAVVAAGEGYTVPDSQEIFVKAVRASFDGTSAAGSYVPTLQIVTDAGIVVAECPAGGTLAAGVSADVSWFPRVAAQTASAPAGSLTVTDGSHTVTAVTELDLSHTTGAVVSDEGGGEAGVFVPTVEITDGMGTTVDPLEVLITGNGIALTNPNFAIAQADVAIITRVAKSSGGTTVTSGGGSTNYSGWSAVLNPDGSVGTTGIHLTVAGVYFIGCTSAGKPETTGSPSTPTLGYVSEFFVSVSGDVISSLTFEHVGYRNFELNSAGLLGAQFSLGAFGEAIRIPVASGGPTVSINIVNNLNTDWLTTDAVIYAVGPLQL